MSKTTQKIDPMKYIPKLSKRLSATEKNKLIAEWRAKHSEALKKARREIIEDKILLTQAEVCDIFSVTPRTLLRWRDDRKIPYININGHIMYELKAIKKMINDHVQCSEK